MLNGLVRRRPPHVQRGHLVPLAAAGRDHDDGHRGAFADLAAQLESVA